MYAVCQLPLLGIQVEREVYKIRGRAPTSGALQRILKTYYTYYDYSEVLLGPIMSNRACLQEGVFRKL